MNAKSKPAGTLRTDGTSIQTKVIWMLYLDFGEGHDIIEDFEDNVDVIQLDNFSFEPGEDSFDYADQVGDDVVFDFGNGDGLTVRDVTIEQMANDLVLV